MNEENLINYYNKFNEDKRLNTRHGKVEFITSMKYIKEYLSNMDNPKIIDIGAGTGKYSCALSDMGYDVTAVELVKHNLRVIEQKNKNVKTYLGNATDLSKFNDNSFDLVLLFGPMYHLISKEDKLKALNEAKRITKDNGIIMVAYCMNDYCVIMHGFIDHHILEEADKLDQDFHVISKNDDLYSVVRLNEIDELNNIVNLQRLKIITPDGPANYLRPILNKMTEEEFNKFIEYHLSTCENIEMIGAAAHTIDIIKKINNI